MLFGQRFSLFFAYFFYSVMVQIFELYKFFVLVAKTQLLRRVWERTGIMPKYATYPREQILDENFRFALAYGLGHISALTIHRIVIQYRNAASLPEGVVTT